MACDGKIADLNISVAKTPAWTDPNTRIVFADLISSFLSRRFLTIIIQPNISLANPDFNNIR